MLKLEETWGKKLGAAVRSWQKNWDNLAIFFDYSKEIRRLVITTYTVEGYHRQLIKGMKNKSSFPMDQAARKMLNFATMDIAKNWTTPIRNLSLLLHQLDIFSIDRWLR